MSKDDGSDSDTSTISLYDANRVRTIAWKIRKLDGCSTNFVDGIVDALLQHPDAASYVRALLEAKPWEPGVDESLPLALGQEQQVRFNLRVLAENLSTLERVQVATEELEEVVEYLQDLTRRR